MIKIMVFLVGLGCIFLWFKKPLASFWIEYIRPIISSVDDSASSALSGEAGLEEADINPLSKEQAQEVRNEKQS